MGPTATPPRTGAPFARLALCFMTRDDRNNNGEGPLATVCSTGLSVMPGLSDDVRQIAVTIGLLIAESAGTPKALDARKEPNTFPTRGIKGESAMLQWSCPT